MNTPVGPLPSTNDVKQSGLSDQLVLDHDLGPARRRIIPLTISVRC